MLSVKKCRNNVGCRVESNGSVEERRRRAGKMQKVKMSISRVVYEGGRREEEEEERV